MGLKAFGDETGQQRDEGKSNRAHGGPSRKGARAAVDDRAAQSGRHEVAAHSE